MIFRKYLPTLLEVNRFLESLKRKVRHDYDIPICVKELSAEYEKTHSLKVSIGILQKDTFLYK